MGSSVLTVGQRLEVGVRDERGLHWYASRLEDHDDGTRRLTIAWPTDGQRRLLRIKQGDLLSVVVSTPRDALYATETRVEGAERGALPLLHLTFEDEWQRLQRRGAVRMAVAIWPSRAVRVPGEGRVRVGINNISATGLQLRSQDELSSGDRLELVFALPGERFEMCVQACVTRVQRDDKIWDAGCQYLGMSPTGAERIVQFIFAQQRALAQRTRGK